MVVDWSQVAKLMEADAAASRFMRGTTNWAAAICRYMAGVQAEQPSPTEGMNIAQRILHVGGRNNAAGYVEFGSIQAVEALVRQVLRDIPSALQLLPASQEGKSHDN